MSIEDLFSAIRESCDSGIWSRAVETTRTSRILLESKDDDEVVLVVEKRNKPAGLVQSIESIPKRVKLYPEDEDWSCDCGQEPCIHVAAAAIVYRQSIKKNRPLEKRSGGKAAHVGYRFRSTGQGLMMQRVAVRDNDEVLIRTSLASLATGRVEGPNLEIKPIDRKIEKITGGTQSGCLPRNVLAHLIDALANCPDVRLDNIPVKASTERSVLHGRITDHPDGYRLYIEQDPLIKKVLPGGFVLLEGDIIQAVGETPLTGREIESLRKGKIYSQREAIRLVSEIIPSISSRIPFEIRTSRLPAKGRKVPVRTVLNTRAAGDELSVLPLVYYGNPPLARLDAGKLVILGREVPVRDLDAERLAGFRLQNELGLEPGKRTEKRGSDALKLCEKISDGYWEVEGKGCERFYRAPPLKPVLNVIGDDMDLRFEAESSTVSDEKPFLSSDEIGGPEKRKAAFADPRKVIEAWKRGDEMVTLEDGGVSPLPCDWLARFGPVIRDLLAAKEAAGGNMPSSLLPDFAGLCRDMDIPPPPAFEKLRILIESTLVEDEISVIPETEENIASEKNKSPDLYASLLKLPDPVLPADLTASLRPYQYEGVRWLSFMKEASLGALLADDMGLGKTVQTLCVIGKRTLIVAPASVVHNWADEIRRFRPSLSFSIYHGAGREVDSNSDVIITTYAILRLDIKILAGKRWNTVVLDESQAIKNPDSKVSRAAFSIPAEHRITLTGTPVENRLEELWSQMHFINPGLLGSLSDFESAYAVPVKKGEPGVASRLRKRIRPFILRRTKTAVAPELPERTDMVLRCILSEDERNVYRAIEASVKKDISLRLASGGGVMEALEALLRLRQAACHVSLVPGQQSERSAKLELLMETLEEILLEGHRALVFSQWTSLLDLVEPCLDNTGIEFCRLDGSTRDRGEVVRRFQDDKGPPVMLVSLKAGGTGLNLTGADHVFLLDPWWNPAVEDQAAGRAHRIGQKNPVVVHRLVSADTVEERILQLQERKRALFDAALGEGDIACGLTRNDLLELLES